MSTNAMLKAIMKELAALAQPSMRKAKERRGDDHGMNLTALLRLPRG